MKQLVILSGKGGTGKTSISASLIHLAAHNSKQLNPLFLDADVDAANLDLLIKSTPLESHEFYGSKIAHIDQTTCIACGKCQTLCRFDAIDHKDNKYQIDPFACEGCQVCFDHCPTHAISMENNLAGHWYRSDSKFGPFYHADLRPGQENSGKLISKIKSQAKQIGENNQHQLLIVDGPPGIGCPVISAISGATLALIVVEPSISGIHDMKRILETAHHFKIPTMVCINKADLNLQRTAEIKAYCQTQNLPILAEIPFDPTITSAMKQNQPITQFQPNSKTSQAIQQLWLKLSNSLFQ